MYHMEKEEKRRERRKQVPYPNMYVYRWKRWICHVNAMKISFGDKYLFERGFFCVSISSVFLPKPPPCFSIQRHHLHLEQRSYIIILLSIFFSLLFRCKSLLGEITREPAEKVNNERNETRKSYSKWNLYYHFEQISENVISKRLQHFRQKRTVYFGLFFLKSFIVLRRNNFDQWYWKGKKVKAKQPKLHLNWNKYCQPT